MDSATRVPVTIVTGFLGAGKTSLLNHLLAGDHGRRIAVLVNDFGAVNIDADLVRSKSADVISLENGCICCNLSDGLLMSAVKVLQTDPVPEHIVIETSGVADPGEVARTFSDPDLLDFAPLDSIVTIVDAQQFAGMTGEARDLADRQVRVADIVLLNKTDIASRSERTGANDMVRRLSRHARIAETTQAQVPADAILGFGGSSFEAADAERLKRHDHRHANDSEGDEQPFESYLYASEAPLQMADLQALVSGFPNTLWRAKGFLYIAERPGDRLILQATPRKAEVQIDGPWGERTPGNRIVFIGERGKVDWQALLGNLS